MHCNVVVLGGDHYNTYGVIRSLGEVGIKSNVIIQGNYTKQSYVKKSKYIISSYVYYDESECIPTLLSFHRDGLKNFIIACNDEIVEILLNNYAEIAEKFILPLCRDYEFTRKLMDKSFILEVASQYGIKVPKSWIAKNRTIPKDITFPCITKPLSSVVGQKTDIVRCNNLKELEGVVKDENHCNDYQIQEYIEFEKEVSILGVVLKNGDMQFTGCIDKLRTCMIGTSSYAVMKDNALLGDNVKKLKCLLSASGYTGLFSAEFLFYKGEYYFLEVNFRNDGNGYVATASGINTPYLWIKSFLENVDLTKVKGKFPCYFMLDLEDFLARRSNKVSMSTWIHNVRNTDCFLVFNCKDIFTFFKKIAIFLGIIIKQHFN